MECSHHSFHSVCCEKCPLAYKLYLDQLFYLYLTLLFFIVVHAGLTNVSQIINNNLDIVQENIRAGRPWQKERSTYFGILKQGSAQSKERSCIRAVAQKSHFMQKGRKTTHFYTVTPEVSFHFQS